MLRRLIRKACRNIQNKIHGFLYDDSVDSSFFWDGTRESLLSLCEYLILNIIELSERSGSYLVSPPIFQKSVHKSKVEKSETFARSFIGGAYYIRLNYENQSASSEEYTRVLGFYKKGIISSFDPTSKDYWGVHNHLIVENTSIIIGLMVTESVVWGGYDDFEKKVIVEYVRMYLDVDTYNNNWIWFKYIGVG